MNMSEQAAGPNTVYLADYRPPSYWIDKTQLSVDIKKGESIVESSLHLRRNSEIDSDGEPLTLDGEDLELLDIAIDGRPLSAEHYQLTDKALILAEPPKEFVLTTRVRILPEQNTSLEGLYRSRTIYCTQCEAEGFRKITYYLDRPDVMSDFTTRITADKDECPVLLSNGNLIESGELEQGRHYVVWHDPHKKPCYLFALVAGSLSCMDDSFRTASGRQVALKIYVEEKDLDKCSHAMESLKNAMRWDEETYGREYDLDIFMIVAVDDFNMGAMENKGLNIFNTSCVLAKAETTTDAGFQCVEGVVAHEYFHNWSGNRVTCRDWFQLSLKEGFTVYRDSEFSADMGSRTVKRVEDVAALRTHQFAEDASPMAHPIRPASYMEISNFYTLTIYVKGAEVVRMLANLLGPEQFRQATDLYFERHDGQAVTTEDFVRAMMDVSGRDLSQFKRWYDQAGTPTLTVSDDYDPETRCYRLNISQSTPPTPECRDKKPFHIPVKMGLLGEAGALALTLQGESPTDLPADNTERVLEVTESEQSFVFTDIPERPAPSLLRGFSAPVKIDYNYSRDDLLLMARQDTDGFNRYEACQNLALKVIDDALNATDLSNFAIDQRLVSLYQTLLDAEHLDRAMVAMMLRLPSEAYIAQQQETIDPQAIHRAREAVASAVSQALAPQCRTLVANYDIAQPYRPSAAAIADRSLKNVALGYLMHNPTSDDLALCGEHLRGANNMTDELSALTALVYCPQAQEQASEALENFYHKWRHEPLVVNHWLSVQARNPGEGTLAQVQQLLQHPAYDGNNPNKLRAVIGSFCAGNPVNFHGGYAGQPDAGYRFLTDQVIELDGKNPQMAARLITPLTRWRRYRSDKAEQMRAQLLRLKNLPGLSADSYEIVSKSV